MTKKLLLMLSLCAISEAIHTSSVVPISRFAQWAVRAKVPAMVIGAFTAGVYGTHENYSERLRSSSERCNELGDICDELREQRNKAEASLIYSDLADLVLLMPEIEDSLCHEIRKAPAWTNDSIWRQKKY